mmetsp:Transcript_47514/g.99389  ORF Transcript_47514/g.99389 Transcript_47514/m.99389 type:complete len:260 (-) Transcript_47514:9-788(-)
MKFSCCSCFRGCACCKSSSDLGCLDRTFKKGHVLRCISITGMVINYVLLVIAFIILAFGVRLGYQERAQSEFIDQQESLELSATGETDVAKMLQDELNRSLSAMSGISLGLILIGVFSVLVATLGLCGSVRGSVGCLYCYTVLLVVVLVTQAGLVAMVSTQMTSVDKYVKENIQASAAAKELVVQNGKQGMYLAMALFVFEFAGFAVALVSRFVIKRANARESWDEEFADLKGNVVQAGRDMVAEATKNRMRSGATRFD